MGWPKLWDKASVPDPRIPDGDECKGGVCGDQVTLPEGLAIHPPKTGTPIPVEYEELDV